MKRRNDPVGPLRRVVDVVKDWPRVERLECGHDYRPRQGHQPMSAVRRRCPQCPTNALLASPDAPKENAR